MIKLQLRTDDDHGTARVIDAFTEEILTEAALLALEHVGQRLQRAIAGAGDGTTMATIVEQRINGLLQHALFVMDNNVRRLELHEVLQPVIPVDHATIKIVEIGGGKATPLEWHERTKIRRDDRQNFEDHPLGTRLGTDESLDDLQTFRELLLDLLRTGGAHLLLELDDGSFHVHQRETIAHGFGTHLRDEGIITILVESLAVFNVGEELLELERSLARIDDHEVLVVDHALEGAGGHVEQETEATRHALEEPNVGDGHREFDVAHALATNARDGHFDATAITDDILVFDALVFAAGALVVAHRAEDLLTEESAWLRLECAVVDRLGVLDLPF